VGTDILNDLHSACSHSEQQLQQAVCSLTLSSRFVKGLKFNVSYQQQLYARQSGFATVKKNDKASLTHVH